MHSAIGFFCEKTPRIAFSYPSAVSRPIDGAATNTAMDSTPRNTAQRPAIATAPRNPNVWLRYMPNSTQLASVVERRSVMRGLSDHTVDTKHSARITA